MEETETVAGQIQMPFVPASERQGKRTIIEDTVKDAIVVVGQSQRKKRKRAGAGAAAAVKAEKSDGDESAEAFDYGAVPNILDEGSDHESGAVEGGRKRRQKMHGASWRVLMVCCNAHRGRLQDEALTLGVSVLHRRHTARSRRGIHPARLNEERASAQCVRPHWIGQGPAGKRL